MVEKRLTVKNPSGLHLRPAGDLCNKAMGFESRIIIRFRNKEFNAKSLLGILSACVQQEDEILLECSGKDETEAAEVLAKFIESGMNEK